MALEAADPGQSFEKVQEWAEKHTIDLCYSVGRDMGAAPPRQTEIRIKLPGGSFDQQVVTGKDAFAMFGFPELPEGAVNVLNESRSTDLCMSIVTSSEGFVRLGLLAPKPKKDAIIKLCALAGANSEDIFSFERAIGADTPQFVEYQYLKEGFGYGVYKEGFDLIFHYSLGEESCE